MKPIVRFSAAIVLAFALPVAAQNAPAANPPQVMNAVGGADLVTLTAKIEAIDLANRVVTVGARKAASSTSRSATRSRTWRRSRPVTKSC